jgi:hypothetical protein
MSDSSESEWRPLLPRLLALTAVKQILALQLSPDVCEREVADGTGGELYDHLAIGNATSPEYTVDAFDDLAEKLEAQATRARHAGERVVLLTPRKDEVPYERPSCSPIRR